MCILLGTGWQAKLRDGWKEESRWKKTKKNLSICAFFVLCWIKIALSAYIIPIQPTFNPSIAVDIIKPFKVNHYTLHWLNADTHTKTIALMQQCNVIYIFVRVLRVAFPMPFVFFCSFVAVVVVAVIVVGIVALLSAHFFVLLSV